MQTAVTYSIVKLVDEYFGGPFMYWGEEFTTLEAARQRFDMVYRRSGEDAEQSFAIVKTVRERLPLHEPGPLRD